MFFQKIIDRYKSKQENKFLFGKRKLLRKIRNFQITDYIDIKVDYKNFKDDEDVILQMIASYNKRFQHFPLWEVPEKIRNKIEIAIEAVKNYPSNLAFLSKDMKSNHFVVKEAVMRDGLSLMYASKELRANLDLIKAALINNIASFDCVLIDDLNSLDVANIVKKIQPQNNVR